MNPSSVAIVSELLDNDLPQVADVLVDKGADYVQEKLGVDLQSNLTPQQIEHLREAAMAHEEFMAKLDEESTQRATNMQLNAMNSQDPEVRHFIYKFAWFWSWVSALYFFAITFVPSTVIEKNDHYADIILGFLLGTAVASIIQFFFGSSKSSQDKTQLLNAKEAQK
ncbi:hypothetical protein [Nitrosomonas sp.]|uniref:hypothetical protein n=1 Tax=Nitrosomonas sp. TaxID=42353 RepID=UPI0025ED450F|nr:hypothetical protein [Nitrosomonas sp.]